jgi:hypothetical protein
MGTIGFTSRRAAARIVPLATVCAALAGCGGARTAETKAQGGIPRLAPALAPASWREARIPTGAVLAYPPRWKLARGDRGTATAILAGPRGRILGYLNITPRQGGESLANWPTFRVAHNAHEGERRGLREGVRTSIHFRTGSGSCVRDSYTTPTGVRYVELACLVRGAHASTVIVGAAPRPQWPAVAPILERAIAAFRT